MFSKFKFLINENAQIFKTRNNYQLKIVNKIRNSLNIQSKVHDYSFLIIYRKVIIDHGVSWTLIFADSESENWLRVIKIREIFQYI